MKVSKSAVGMLFYPLQRPFMYIIVMCVYVYIYIYKRWGCCDLNDRAGRIKPKNQEAFFFSVVQDLEFHEWKSSFINDNKWNSLIMYIIVGKV